MFVKKPVKTGNVELDRVLNDMFSQLEIILTNKTLEYIILTPLKKEPDKKFNGMIVYFDNVGGKTGFYGYENGVWVKL
jgi:hypothetical protein